MGTSTPIPSKLNGFLQLMKPKVSIAVTLSALAGYALKSKSPNPEMLFFGFALFMVIAASSAINHIQEAKYDKLMKRTQKRPIPTGVLTHTEAIVFALFLSTTGTIMLLTRFNWSVPVTTIFAGLWYNLVYTPLKRKTAFAVLPGALIGAIPPFIGWWAANGEVFAVQITALSAFFFIGQIPHFWILMHKYKNDYKRAGYPVIHQKWDTLQINRLTIYWMTTGIVAALFLTITLSLSKGAVMIIMGYALLFLIFIFNDLLKPYQIKAKRNFIMLNLLYLIVTVSILTDYLLK